MTASVKVGAGRPVRSRRDRTVAALTAAGQPTSGVQQLTTFDMTRGSFAQRLFYEEALKAGYLEMSASAWPNEEVLLDHDDQLLREGNTIVFRMGSVLALVSIEHGWFHASVAANDRTEIAAAFAYFAERYMPLYHQPDEEATTVPITFWTYGPFGPQSRLRLIEAARWDGIEGNYTATVREQLDAMMLRFEPGKDGQLLLWQGPPGTGKTWALRALASEWRDWAEFHYITDPDAFFVTHPDYMIDVLLSDSYEAFTEPSAEGDIDVVNVDRLGKWRILILEDTGELLAANAKESYGQGLSRLLNVVDGMVGQGLRVLLLVTTNDELGTLHAAVARPGRCAAQIEFLPLTPEEVAAWMEGEEATEGMTLAELYAARPGEAADAEIDTAKQIARVAEKHQPEEPAYGQCAWDSDTGTVYWINWDGTSIEEESAATADFMEIEGVERVYSEAESIPNEGWWGAEVVYPDNPPLWVVRPTPDPNAALDPEMDELLAAARAPLPDLEPPASREDEIPADTRAFASGFTAILEAARSGQATGRPLDLTVAAALETLALSHQRTVEGIAGVLAASARETGALGSDTLALAALGVLDAFARRPEAPAPPAPVFHVHTPQHDLSVHVDAPVIEPPVVTVNLPEQPAPIVTVEAAEAPVVNVTIPEQPAPVVHVAPAEVTVTVPAPAPRSVRVEVDDHGVKRYVTEED